MGKRCPSPHKIVSSIFTFPLGGRVKINTEIKEIKILED